MAAIKVIWGPHKTIERSDCMVWEFSGVRSNGEQCKWRLIFYFDSRQFRCRFVSTKRERENHLTEPDMFRLPEIERADTSVGRVTDMLKAKLSPRHIARASALAIRKGRP